MNIRKSATTLSLVGLFTANVAFALPSFTEDAPQSSVDTCLAEVRAAANFADAGSVAYTVETQERRVSGHTMRIATLVFDADGESVLRE